MEYWPPLCRHHLRRLELLAQPPTLRRLVDATEKVLPSVIFEDARDVDISRPYAFISAMKNGVTLAGTIDGRIALVCLRADACLCCHREDFRAEG